MTLPYWTALPEALSSTQKQLIGELRALKDAHQLSFQELGRLTHFSRASWERWLNGKRPVTREALESLIAALGADDTRLLQLLGDLDPSAAHADRQPADADTAASRAPAPAPAPAVSPAQLPAVVTDFTGRREQLRELAQLLTGTAGFPGQVPIAAVTGPGGLGKTALAVQAGHLVAHHFPDGQLYTDLGGADPTPQSAADVLSGWLRALGEAAGSMPSRPEELAARFRTLLAGRRVLVLLDNAASAAQIRPLIPGTNGCAVLVTARTRLSDLLGAHHLPLTALDEGASRQLLTTVIGERRTTAEPEALQRVLDGCAGLPLALRIAAARLANRTAWKIATLADRLDDERHRLDELAVGDLAIRAAFQASYSALAGSGPRTAEQDDEPTKVSAAQAFRLLGLFPGSRFTAHAVAALLDVSLRRAEDLLDTLVEAHLLEADSHDRYRLHDLLRTYAAELTHQAETAAQRYAARERVTAWYLYACQQTQRDTGQEHVALDISTVARPEPAITFADRDTALAWLDAEQPNLLAVTRLTADLDLGPITWLLSRHVLNYYLLRALWRDAVEMSQLAVAAARAHGATEVLPRALAGISMPYAKLGLLDEAVQVCREAFEIAEQLELTRDAGYSALLLADALGHNGRFDEAEPWYHRGIERYRAAGASRELSQALNNTAWAFVEAGRYQAALPLAIESLELIRTTGNHLALGGTLDTLGIAYRELGCLDEALDTLHAAVDAYTKADSRFLGADALDHYADTLATAHRHKEAQAAWNEAAHWFDTTDQPRAITIRAKARQAAATSPRRHPATP
ncbi:tetratricopeptide repeat protein [Streptomyces sp. tea 10]|nr:tetratricopeptide repeat protein [Streptomyces sp. tea 10]